jgi:hypothetical protein
MSDNATLDLVEREGFDLRDVPRPAWGPIPQLAGTAAQLYCQERRRGVDRESARTRAAHAFGVHLGSRTAAAELDRKLVIADRVLEQEAA